MKIRYITNPPKVLDVPRFIAKRYNLFDKTFIEKLVSWSIREYYDMIVWLYSVNQTEMAKVLETQYSSVDFLSRCKSFQIVLDTIKPDLWRSLNRDTQEQLINAKNIFLQYS